MIPFEEALARLLASVVPVGAERVSLAEADGRVLAEDIEAAVDLPPFDYSAMDGYAVRIEDFDGAGPWTLPVSGESTAGGDVPELLPKSVCRIFTGARLPTLADAVVMQERVERSGESAVFQQKPKPQEFVRKRGADLSAGAIALRRGTRLRPGDVALAAALDRPELAVARRPAVVVLATGDELRAPGSRGRPGSIAESNAYYVAAAARRAGALVRLAPFVGDDFADAKAAVAEALRGADMVVTIGGVSVGDRDVMRPALEATGVVLDFWRVQIKPGKPIAVGRAGAVHVLGLPGNPASASLTFLLFGAPVLRALQGDARPLPPRLDVTVDAGFSRDPGRLEFVRARLDERTRVAHVLPNQASGAVTSFAQADTLVLVPPERDRIAAGDRFEAIRIADF